MALTSVRFASILSLLVGAVVLALKFAAFYVTGSQAVFSDALESIVNVVAAGVALLLISYGARPADDNHPYGHGKTEFFSASFEGGLITFAAIAIVIRAIDAVVIGRIVTELDLGLVIVTIAGIFNLLLALYLLHVSKKEQSAALAASGHHILSDCMTTAGSLIGLGLVKVTGIGIFDPIAALFVGSYLGYTGFRIVRGGLAGLLDEEDTKILKELARAFNAVQAPGILKMHRTRVMRAGSYHFVDAHVVVPEFWDVRYAHDQVNHFERKVIEAHSHTGEIHFHLDPCRQLHCAECDLVDCKIRRVPFQKRLDANPVNMTAKKAEGE